MKQPQQPQQQPPPFTVYAPGDVSRPFADAEVAYLWAKLRHQRTGGTYECRDANFDHVFTLED